MDYRQIKYPLNNNEKDKALYQENSYNLRKEKYKNFVSNKLNTSSLDISQGINKNFTTNNNQTSRVGNHRLNYSHENIALKNKFQKKELIYSENIKNTIDKYDFQMNFDLLKVKLEKLNHLMHPDEQKKHKKT